MAEEAGVIARKEMVYETESFEYFRRAIFRSYDGYTHYKYIEEEDYWYLHAYVSPELAISYRLEKNTAEEAIFLNEKEDVDDYIYRTRVHVINQTGGSIPNEPKAIIRELLTDGYGNDNLLIDGETTPTTFYLKSPDGDLYLNELRFVFSSSQLRFNNTKFGSRPELENGILVEIQVNGDNPVELSVIKKSEDFLFYNAPGNLLVLGSGVEDVLVAGFNLDSSIILRGNSEDAILVTVRDDLTHVSYHHLKCMVYGYTEEGSYK